MLWNIRWNNGVFKADYRQQLLATLSVTIISLSHGVALGWFSPMLMKMQSPETPLNFSLDVHESSWLGAMISLGALTGNTLFSIILSRLGRKVAIYSLAFPHALLWLLLYYARSINYLYAARFFTGFTGGGSYVVVPIFVGEICNSSIRGRLTSLFGLTINLGTLFGYILSSHVRYHNIPWIVLPLPCLFLFLVTRYPETPQFLLRAGKEKRAEQAFIFYQGRRCMLTLKENLRNQFEQLKSTYGNQTSAGKKVTYQDFLEGKSLKVLGIGLVLGIIHSYSGLFAFMSYMSNIFAATKTDLHPDTNTIITGVVQVIGSYLAIGIVDRYGRRILMITSITGVGLGTAALGLYAFLVEKNDIDLSSFSYWLPVFLMSFIIFMANIGLNAIVYVIMVEILPSKIRSIGTMFFMVAWSISTFISLKLFPMSMHFFGLSSTMWFCSAVSIFGVLFVAIFLKETKGISFDGVDNVILS
uniref:Major facilitator superfamily (MFS) profile domain-containing protein n=1 Tax=Glossina morsitans morsitans TaxID=37546 RepID=A0A1B0GG41_GLOMM